MGQYRRIWTIMMHEECPTWTDCIADLSEELQIEEAWDNVEYWSLTQRLIKRCKNCPAHAARAGVDLPGSRRGSSA